jgi:DNA-binding NtrC family response regulator
MAKRIIVVDDDRSIRHLFKEVLTEAGYEVVMICDATGKIEHIKQIHPDLIILDYIFAGEGRGWDVLNKLKAIASLAAVPIVLCSGAHYDIWQIKSQLANMNVPVLEKPFGVNDLIEIVRESIGT